MRLAIRVKSCGTPEDEAAMTLDLRPEIAEGLATLASVQGLSVEDYLQRLVSRELPAPTSDVHDSSEWHDS